MLHCRSREVTCLIRCFPLLTLSWSQFWNPRKKTYRSSIAQLDAFLESPEIKARLPSATPRPLIEENYKEMWMLRYQQHMGQMTFLELLDKYEEILGISPRIKLEE